MSQPHSQGNPPIIIQNINTNSQQLPNDPNKKDNGKTAIWAALIGLIGVIGVPLIVYFLPSKKEQTNVTPVNSQCVDLKKQITQQEAELKEIKSMLKSKPNDLKLQADKITHSNNIQIINNKLKSSKCD